MLTKEQISQIKEQLFKQLESWPESQRGSAKEQIESMDNQEFEEFLIKNKMIKNSDEENQTSSQCIFCSIVKEQILGYKIAENENSIAVLEINPISKGHTIIIPKQHINSESLTSEQFSFAEEISEKIKHLLKPKSIQIKASEIFGHGIINILPVYKEETLSSPRKKASEKELKSLQEKLMSEIKPAKSKKEEKKTKPETKEKIQVKKLEPGKLPKAPIRRP